MFHEIRGFFHGIGTLAVDDQGTPTSEDLQLAAAVLLIETARLNKEETQQEDEVILKALEANFGIPLDKARSLMETASSAARDGNHLPRFLEIIHSRFDDEQKQIVLATVWRVIAADGIVDKYEAALAAGVRTSLGLTLEQSIRSRRLAESGEDLTLEGILPARKA